MSIGKQISETIDKMEAGDPEGALYQISSAIDATAKKEIGKSKVGERYKEFIHENLGLITDIAFGCQYLNLNLQFTHPDLKPNAQGFVSVEAILYHVVRCGLVHETEVPADLKFHNENKICTKDGILLLPQSLIYGLITAVVTSPANSREKTTKESQLNFGPFPIPLCKLWGRRKELLWLLDVDKELGRLHWEESRKKGTVEYDKKG